MQLLQVGDVLVPLPSPVYDEPPGGGGGSDRGDGCLVALTLLLVCSLAGGIAYCWCRYGSPF